MSIFEGIQYASITSNINKNVILKLIEEFAKQNKIKAKYLTLKQLNETYLRKQCIKGGSQKNRIKITPPNMKL